MKYGEPGNTTAIENAIYDFQIFLLGLQVRGGFLHAPVVPETQPQDVVRRLSETADRFQELLATADREEDLQAFIKDHPMLLDEASDRIPKQKLGEDFVTDFVIVRQTAQGHVYTLVEIEKASHSVVNKDGSLTGAVSHAIAQTRSWDIWLEKNKNYLQGKLPGFESPNYLVVIGRSTTLSEDQKAHLRSENRARKDTQIVTYDDLLIRFRGVIGKLQAMEAPVP